MQHDMQKPEHFDRHEPMKQIEEHHHKEHTGSSDVGQGHFDHHRMMIRDYRTRFYISLILSIPVLALSSLIQNFLGYGLSFANEEYLTFLLSSFIYFYGGWPFFRGLIDELQDRRPAMMTLIGMAVTVAYLYSTAVLLGLQGEPLFWELVTLIDIMLLGHWLEMKSVLGASAALEKLAQLLPDTAHKLAGGVITDVSISNLQQNDQVLIKPGEKIPVDGFIFEGESYLDESMVTGESKPVFRMSGDRVIGGSINGEGSLKVRVSGVGEDSYLNKVFNLVRRAQNEKSRTQRLADRAAFWLTLIALTAGVITFIAWTAGGQSLAFAIERAVTVMVIACPHALGLAVPLVVAVSTSLSARRGLLIRNRTAFENAHKITTVVFDKTGTLTKGSFGVSDYRSVSYEFSDTDVIRLAAAVEQYSEHPLAEGILRKAHELQLSLPPVTGFKAYKGKGIRGTVEGKMVMIVSPGYLEAKSIQSFPFEQISADEAATTVYVLIENQLVGSVTLTDEIRKESYAAVKALQASGVKCLMLTGDNKNTAAIVSDELGLDGHYAEVLPEEKLAVISELQGQGEFVAMTGDGVNDAPALAQADIGIAIGSGTDVAAETADIVLVDSNPRDVVTLIHFGRAVHRKMVQNLFWATGYNILALPLAAGVLIGANIIISPAVGAIFMSLSTVIVAINAKLLSAELL